MSIFDVIAGRLKDEVFALTMERAELRSRLTRALKERRRVEREHARILRDLRTVRGRLETAPVPAVPLRGVIS